MIFVALSEAADKGELLLVQDGMCRWHRRQDGIVVIREIIVLPFRRRTGVGRRLVAEVITRNPKQTLLAKCPIAYTSGNSFWPAMGFVLLETKDGINTWQRLASFSVPEVINGMQQ